MALFSKRRAKQRKDQQQSVSAAPAGQAGTQAPDSQIGYHPDLIPRFEKTHQSLRKTFAAIKTHAAHNDFDGAQQALQTFRRTLGGHLLEENVKLYTYLSKCLAHDPANHELMQDMKAEMGGIGTKVTRFIRHYSEEGINAANKQVFLTKLEEIGAVLVERMEREETSLYTMYLPPESLAG